MRPVVNICIVLLAVLAAPLPAVAETVRVSDKAQGELRLPAGSGPHPAVVLMHGCAGLTAPVRRGLKRHGDALIAAGFAVLVLDSFTGRGNSGGAVCNSTTALNRAWTYRLRDARDAHGHLAARDDIDKRNIFLMGQSNGGTVALLVAGGGAPFRAVAAYYPWCGVHASGRTLSAPLLVMIGAEDDWTPADLCREAEPKLRGAAFDLVIYPGAHHSFDLPIARQTYAGHTVGGAPRATRLSRARMIAFFKRHLMR